MSYQKDTAINYHNIPIVLECDAAKKCSKYRAFINGLPIRREVYMCLRYGFIEEEISKCYVCIIEAFTGKGMYQMIPERRAITGFEIGQAVLLSIHEQHQDKKEKVKIGPIKMEVVGYELVFEDSDTTYEQARLTLKQIP